MFRSFPRSSRFSISRPQPIAQGPVGCPTFTGESLISYFKRRPSSPWNVYRCFRAHYRQAAYVGTNFFRRLSALLTLLKNPLLSLLLVFAHAQQRSGSLAINFVQRECDGGWEADQPRALGYRGAGRLRPTSASELPANSKLGAVICSLLVFCVCALCVLWLFFLTRIHPSLN